MLLNQNTFKMKTIRILLFLKKVNLFIFCTLIFYLFSCQSQDEENILPKQKFDIEVENGVLKINSFEEMSEILTQLRQMPANDFSFEKNYKGFESAYSAYFYFNPENYSSNYNDLKFISIVENEYGELEADLIVDDLFLAKLLNSSGEVIIGDYLYRFSYSSIEKISIDDHSIENISINRNSLNVSYKILDSECEDQYSFGSRTRRLKGEAYTTNAGVFYSAAGARTKHQRYWARIWWRTQARQLRLQFNGTFRQYLGGPSSPLFADQNISYDSGWLNDDGRDSYNWEFCLGAPCYFEILNMQSTHQAIVELEDRRNSPIGLKQCLINF